MHKNIEQRRGIPFGVPLTISHPYRRAAAGLMVALLAALAFAGLGPQGVGAHPAAGDVHNACFEWVQGPVPLPVFPPTPMVVGGTESYVDYWGSSLNPGCQWEWGSHAGVCPPPPWIVTVAGAFCGPLVAPGQSASCMLDVISPAGVPYTGLVIGFDVFPFDGQITHGVDGPVFGGNLTVHQANPHPLPARVIAFPSNTYLTNVDPGALHSVSCWV